MGFFTKHLETIKETYWEHFYFASMMGVQMLLGGIACIVHAILPFLFEKTASNFLMRLIYQFIDRSKTMEPRLLALKEHIENKKNNA